MRKRIFSVVLALCMVLGLLPMTAWASEGKYSIFDMDIPFTNVFDCQRNTGVAVGGTQNAYLFKYPYSDSESCSIGSISDSGFDDGFKTNPENYYYKFSREEGDKIKLNLYKRGQINPVHTLADNGTVVSYGQNCFLFVSEGGYGTFVSLRTDKEYHLYDYASDSDCEEFFNNNRNLTGQARYVAHGCGESYVVEQINLTAEQMANMDVKTYSVVLKDGSNALSDTVTFTQFEDKTVIVENTGNQATGKLTVTLGDSSTFVLKNGSGDSGFASIEISNILASETANFIVAPKSGLAAGTYSTTVFVNGVNGISKSFTVSYTVSDTHTHCVCGASHADVGDHTGADNKTFEAWNETNALPTEEGKSYYLTDNVTLTSGTWTVPNNTVLCLNGHTITGADGQATITVDSGVNFTLTDCDSQKRGAINHADGKTGYGVHNEGTFNMYSGKITKNSLPTNDTSGGAGVKNGLNTNASAQFTMYGGEISNNNSSNWNGGGVDSNGTFNMFGGSIINNTAASNKNGGGVYINDGTFNVSGNVNISGNVKGGTITGTTLSGGTPNNVYLTSGETITIAAGGLSNTTPIGVTTEDAPTAGYPTNVTVANGTDYSGYFASDEGFRVVDKEDGGNHVVQFVYGDLSITPSTISMRGKGTVTLTVVNTTGDDVVTVTCDDTNYNPTGNGGDTYSVYLPNRTQRYIFTATTVGGQTATCTVDVRKKSSSSSVEEEKPAEKPEEKPAEKPEEKPEEVSKNNEIVLTIGEKVAVVFGDPVVNDVAPVIRSDRAMLPIRFVVEALGGTVTWNQAQQSVTCVKGDSTITIYIGHPFALVNGNPVELDSPAFIENDRTYLPIRFVAENLDATVTWDADTQEVTVVPDK